MIYELSLFLVALIGSAIGGWIDLKTTEIPDIVPASMAGLGLLLHTINALSTGIWANVYYSIAVGLVFLVFGYILYYTGQWGEADVLLLAAVGVVLPQPLSFFSTTMLAPFPAVFILNTFIIGGIYSLVYSIILALRNRDVFPAFIKGLKSGPSKKEATVLGLSALAYIFAVRLVAYFLPGSGGVFLESLSVKVILYNILVFLPALAFVFVFYKFAHAVDTVAFRKKVNTADLREGDVLAKDAAGLKSKLYIGLEAKQIEAVRKEKKEVWIKEGVRYGPTFFLAIVATWLWGNVLFLFLRII